MFTRTRSLPFGMELPQLGEEVERDEPSMAIVAKGRGPPITRQAHVNVAVQLPGPGEAEERRNRAKGRTDLLAPISSTKRTIIGSSRTVDVHVSQNRWVMLLPDPRS